MKTLSRLQTLVIGGLVLAAFTATSFSQDKAKPATPGAAISPAPLYKYKTNLKGPADAPIKVVEFADFMCPACQAASGALRGYFEQQGADINLTFKNFPLERTCNSAIQQTIHNGACELALGAVCASELGNFWGYHDRIFSRAWERATRQDVLDNAAAAGMDRAKFDACMESSAAKSKLAIQIKEGVEVGVGVTPTLVVNGRKLTALNQFSATVDEERKKISGSK
jgi:protein-disulfide isomerase